MLLSDVSDREFKEIYYKMHGKCKVIITGEFLSMSEEVECRCKNQQCGHVWRFTGEDLMIGHGCPICFMDDTNNLPLDFDSDMEITDAFYSSFKNSLFRIESTPRLVITGVCTGSDTPVAVYCKECDHTKYLKPRSVLRSPFCRICQYKQYAQSNGKTGYHGTLEKIIKNYLNYFPDSEVDIIGKYHSPHKHIECQCTICGHTWGTEPGCLRAGTGCPVCASSKGEQYIYNRLLEANIEFEREFAIPGKGRLRYDFRVGTKVLIEFDGIQHREFVEFFHKTLEGFEDAKRRDAVKTDWAECNDYTLYRVTSIEEFDSILPKILSKNHLTRA
jgi:very-short-patch-repair endonuclease